MNKYGWNNKKTSVDDDRKSIEGILKIVTKVRDSRKIKWTNTNSKTR